MDLEEKQYTVRLLAGMGRAAVDPILNYLRTEGEVTWAVRALREILRARNMSPRYGTCWSTWAARTRAGRKPVVLIEHLPDEALAEVRQTLLRFLDDEDDDVCIAAADCLARSGDEEIRERLIETLLNAEFRPRVRGRILELFCDREWAVKGFRKKVEGSAPGAFYLTAKGTVKRRPSDHGAGRALPASRKSAAWPLRPSQFLGLLLFVAEEVFQRLVERLGFLQEERVAAAGSLSTASRYFALQVFAEELPFLRHDNQRGDVNLRQHLAAIASDQIEQQRHRCAGSVFWLLAISCSISDPGMADVNRPRTIASAALAGPPASPGRLPWLLQREPAGMILVLRPAGARRQARADPACRSRRRNSTPKAKSLPPTSRSVWGGPTSFFAKTH